MEEEKHFRLPNFTSILPTYTNVEQDDIRSAFTVGNHVSLRELPNKIRYNSIINSKIDKSKVNIRSGIPGGGGRKITKNGLFEQFEYIPSRYSLADEILMKERLEDEAVTLGVGGKPFVPGSNKLKLKFENAFEDKDGNIGAFKYMSDPYEAAQNQNLRAKWIEDSKILHGPFIPSGTKKALEAPSRSLLPDICKAIHQVIARDWGDLEFSVQATEDDDVVVRFSLMAVESELGVESYMNCLLKKNDTINDYMLRKVVEDWCTKPGDGYLSFIFRPPWIHTRSSDSYYTLHPEERIFGSK